MRVCFACWSDLSSADAEERPPKFSLANGLWLGEVPVSIQSLTMPERYLIARGYPRASIVKLFPKNRKHRWDPETLQSGLRGNVTTYNLNQKAIVEMLQGQRLPHPINTLASMISVTYVGVGDLPRNWLHSTFRVRRSNIRAALGHLKEHNRHCQDIAIDGPTINMFPEDEVPMEILATIRQETDAGMVEREMDGSAPDHSAEDIESGFRHANSGALPNHPFCEDSETNEY